MEYYYLAKYNQIKGPFSAAGMRCLTLKGTIDENTKIVPAESICWQRQVFTKPEGDPDSCPHGGKPQQGTEEQVLPSQALAVEKCAGNSMPNSVQPANGSNADTMEYYYLDRYGQIKGPFSAAGMRCLAEKGIVDENTKIVPAESIRWQRQVFIKQEGDLGPCPHCGELLQGAEVPVVCPHCCGPLHPGTESPWGNVRYSIKRLFSGKGRATRREFWCYLVFSLLVYVGIVSLALSLGELHNGIADDVAMVVALLLVPLLLIGIAVMVRRMHDCGKSGWFILCGGLFLLFFKRSQPGPNEYGPSVPCPHV